jgi:uncharacterized protein (DUF1684 family)
MASTHQDEVLRWREDRVRRLTGPDGWLTVVGLAWLQDGENPVGSAPENPVHLPRGPAHAGTIRVKEGAAVATLDAGSGVTHDGIPVTVLDLQDDSLGEPTVLRLSSLAFYVIRRGGRVAVRIKDEDSPARKAFTGIESFPIDPGWRVRGRFVPSASERNARVPTVLGLTESYQVPGSVEFDHEGQLLRLEAFLEEGETDLFVVFGDLTNRSETYGGGRYLYAAPPDDQGIVVVDFNKAYNPPCVFTPFATCALPLPENRLPIRVEAGEKLYRGPTLPPVVPGG